MDQASVSDQLHFIGIEHYDEFPDAVLFWVDVSNPPREIQKAAKIIDGQDYRASGFGLCIFHERASNRYDIVTDTDPATGDSRNIFYIDHDGGKHWFQADISKEFTAQVLEKLEDEIFGPRDAAPAKPQPSPKKRSQGKER